MKKYNFAGEPADPSGSGDPSGLPAEKLSPRAKRLVIIGGVGIVLVGALYVYTSYFASVPPSPAPVALREGGLAPSPPPMRVTPPRVQPQAVKPPLALGRPALGKQQQGAEVAPPQVKGRKPAVSPKPAMPAKPAEFPRPVEASPEAPKPTLKALAKVAKPGAKADKEYSIQVASLVRERNALSLKERLERLGYSPTIRKTTARITRHRVYAGEFRSREEAERVARRLNVEGFPSNLVELELGKFGLEVGASFTLNGAIDMARNLQEKNYTPKIVSKATPTPVHQVRVGEFKSRTQAVRALEVLKTHGFKPLIIKE